MKKLVWIVLWVLCFSFASAEYVQDYGTAYKWAHENWIVTDASYSAANLYSVVSRVEFASMLMGFAKNVLKMKDPVTTTCNFIDIDALNWGYKNAALWACERWIMWYGTSVFNPNATLNLADFWSTLSRLFWWEKYSDWVPYYINHLWALKSIWAIDDISEPFWALMKWDVLVMLMNSIKTIDFSAGPNAPATDTYVHAAAGQKPTPVYYDPNAYSHAAAGPMPNVSYDDYYRYADYYGNTNNNSYTFDYNDRVANCYRLIDNCRNSSINSDIACEYVCCDENGFWVANEASGTCAPRPGYRVTTAIPIITNTSTTTSTTTSTGSVVTTTTTTSTTTGAITTTTSTGTVTTTTAGTVDTSDVKTNCWTQSTDSEDVEECGRCLWLKNYSEDSIKFWVEKNDPLLLDCPVNSDECKVKRFTYEYPGSKTANKFHTLVLDLNGEDINKSADKWLKETFNEDEVKFIYKCEQQRYETFKNKKKAEILDS